MKNKKTFLFYFTLMIVTLFFIFSGILPSFLNHSNWQIPRVKATNAQIATGSYVGNGIARAITGVGFEPNIIIIKSDLADGQAVFKTTDMAGDATAFLANADVNFSGGITSLDSDGFSIGTNTNTNASLAIYQWIAIYTNNASDIVIGSYTGDGNDSRNITGLGINPDTVIIKGDIAQLAVWKSSSMANEITQFFSGNSESTANIIQSLITDGFQVGTDATVNNSGTTYYYIAFTNSAGVFAEGTYTGDGTDDRDITAPNFQPSFVFIKQSTTEIAIMRTNKHYGDQSMGFTAVAQTTDQIQSFLSTGFQIGTSSTVNASGGTYYYLAIAYQEQQKTESFSIYEGNYVGSGTATRAITGIGFKPDIVIIKSGNHQGTTIFTTSLFPEFYSMFSNANGIIATGMTLDEDGFTLISGLNTNNANTPYHFIAIGNLNNSNNFSMGVYTGNNIDGREVSGLGFQPDFVMVKNIQICCNIQTARFRTSAMTGDTTSAFNAEANGTNMIEQLTSDGFVLGNHASVNANINRFIYIAFKNTSGKFHVGSYTGDGNDDRALADLDFNSNWLFIKQSDTRSAIQRFRKMIFDVSIVFYNGLIPIENAIQSFSDSGFTVGSDATANQSGSTYYYVAFDGQAETEKSGNFTMKTGSYMGNGAIGREVNAVGFRPDLLFIKTDTGNGSFVWAQKDMAEASLSSLLVSGAAANNYVTNLTDTGFVVHDSNNVNQLNAGYQWIAFQGNTSTNYISGLYMGNGNDNRNLIGLGFQPDVIIIKGNDTAVWRSSSMSGDISQLFSNGASAANNIQSILSDGFQVGSSANVNANYVLYQFVAFKNTTNQFYTNTYTGNTTDNRSISGVGFKPDFVLTGTSAQNKVFKTNRYYGEVSGLLTATAITTDLIQSLETDGFQIGTNAMVNNNTSDFYYFAIKGETDDTPTGEYLMKTGSYSGTGVAQTISGLGFQPDVVFIKSDTNAGSLVFKTKDLMDATTSAAAYAVVNFTGGISTLTSDGFSIGTNANVNTNGVTYRYIAFANSGSTNFKTGFYTGTGIDNYSFSGVGFQPDYVLIKSNNTARFAVSRNSSMVGDLTSYFAGTAEAANLIQAIETNGFQLGSSDVVNGLGTTYFYIAFKSTTGKMQVGTYTGDGQDNRSISGVGFQPSWVTIKHAGTTGGVHRSDTLSGDLTQYNMATANLANAIQQFETDGFQIGTHASVNSLNITYRYAAWMIPPPDVQQTSFRWRDDNGSETTATWLEDENTSLTSLTPNSEVRLRIAIANTGTTTGNYNYRLEFGEKSTTCSAISSWTQVPASATTEAWEMYNTTNLTDGSATTNVSGGLTDANSSFVAGEQKDTSAQTGNISLTNTQFTEIEYSIIATENAGNNSTYCFRLTNAGSTTYFTYDYYPEATISAAAISITLTTDGAMAFGTAELNTLANGDNYETVQIDNGPANINIKASNFTQDVNTWIIGTDPGNNQAKLEFSKDNTNWSTISEPNVYQSFDSNVASLETRNLYMRVTLPTSTDSYNQYSSGITLIAVAP